MPVDRPTVTLAVARTVQLAVALAPMDSVAAAGLAADSPVADMPAASVAAAMVVADTDKLGPLRD
jgi:hypothetical protein